MTARRFTVSVMNNATKQIQGERVGCRNGYKKCPGPYGRGDWICYECSVFHDDNPSEFCCCLDCKLRTRRQRSVTRNATKSAKQQTVRSIKLATNENGRITGTHGATSQVPGVEFSARLDLLVIKAAWEAGVSFENLADGFGPGRGTQGDWSGIRDSSEEATMKMLERALRSMTFNGAR
jgi:hypothetical protein